MSDVPPEELVVHCALHDEEGRLVRRLLVRVPAAPASAALAAVLRLELAERRRRRRLSVEAPPQVVALLALCGIDDGPIPLRP